MGAWETLPELNLSDSLLKPQRSLVLVKHLHEGGVMEHLHTLKLQYKESERDALERSVHVITKKLPNLKVLDLYGNRFEEDSEDVEALTTLFEDKGFGVLNELDDLEGIDSDEEDEFHQERKILMKMPRSNWTN